MDKLHTCVAVGLFFGSHIIVSLISCNASLLALGINVFRFVSTH